MPHDSEAKPLTHWRGYELNPFQVRAVAAIRAGHNVLVGAPTGAGKTLVAEYAVEEAVARRRRCIYTSPIKALSNQKYRDFRAQGMDVGLLTGDVTLHPRAQVLIMTTEILRNSIFENPRELEDVEFAVFDEVHYLDDSERGSVWEESLIFAPPSMRFICLSATVPNIFELGKWLGSIRPHELEVIESRDRPVPLHHRVFVPPGTIGELADLGRLRKRAGELAPRRARDQRWKKGGRDRGPRPPDPALATEVLIDEIQDRRLLPALVFAFSRKDCERLAERASRRNLLSPAEAAQMLALQKELLESFQLGLNELDGQLLSMGRRGIGFHHAGVLPIHKELVERMFTSGLLKLLFTTETFALGINMPARTVIFHALEKFNGVEMTWLRAREYMQMAGRAGRQGIDDEGLVYSVLHGRALTEAPLEKILGGNPEPVMSRFQLSYSSLLHLVPSLGRARVHEAWEKSFNRFQHRSGSPSAQARNRRRQDEVVDAHLRVLEDLGYLEPPETLTARGKIARVINGFELQVTELLYHGALETLGPEALAIVFVALIHQERFRGGGGQQPNTMYANVRKHVAQTIHRVTQLELHHGVPDLVKEPDFGLTRAVIAWCNGASIDELPEFTEASPGDVCRTLRMAIQLMREVRRAIDPDWDVFERLGSAIELINRDEVDARRQLELG